MFQFAIGLALGLTGWVAVLAGDFEPKLESICTPIGVAFCLIGALFVLLPGRKEAAVES